MLCSGAFSFSLLICPEIRSNCVPLFQHHAHVLITPAPLISWLFLPFGKVVLPFKVSMFCSAEYQYVWFFCFLVFVLGDLAKQYWYLISFTSNLFHKKWSRFFFLNHLVGGKFLLAICLSLKSYFVGLFMFVFVYALLLSFLPVRVFFPCAFYQIEISFMLLLIWVFD